MHTMNDHPAGKTLSEQTNQRNKKERESTPSQRKANSKDQPSKTKPAPQPRKSKATALRAKKRAVARKARKQRLIGLLNRHDQALKAGRSKMVAKFASALRKEKAGKHELTQMREVIDNLRKAEKSIEKQTSIVNTLAAEKVDAKNVNSKPNSQREVAVAEKKKADAVTRLKRAQQAEQEYFAALMKKTKNGVCPFCDAERLSIDSHVMDMHPPRWGEYLDKLGKID